MLLAKNKIFPVEEFFTLGEETTVELGYEPHKKVLLHASLNKSTLNENDYILDGKSIVLKDNLRRTPEDELSVLYLGSMGD